MRAFLIVVEVFLKCLIGLVTGIGVGTLVVGVALVQEGVKDFSGPGPPPAPFMIGSGAGLLMTALTILILFVGPLGRRRWFLENDDALSEKWRTSE